MGTVSFVRLHISSSFISIHLTLTIIYHYKSANTYQMITKHILFLMLSAKCELYPTNHNCNRWCTISKYIYRIKHLSLYPDQIEEQNWWTFKAYFRQAEVVVLFIKFLSLTFAFCPLWGHGRGHIWAEAGPSLHEFITELYVSICGLPCSRTPWQCSEGVQAVEGSSRTTSEHIHVLPIPGAQTSNPPLLRSFPIIIIHH